MKHKRKQPRLKVGKLVKVVKIVDEDVILFPRIGQTGRIVKYLKSDSPNWKVKFSKTLLGVDTSTFFATELEVIEEQLGFLF